MNKKVIVKDNKLYIEISFKKRKYASEEKIVFSDDVRVLIPKEYQEVARLISKPKKKISNIGAPNFLTSGEWVFDLTPIKITKKELPKSKPQNSRSRRRKKLTT
tara:strand:+ start:165 stop:476 length:312 start_codon:yes stop_codon:yes gene_type:complete